MIDIQTLLDALPERLIPIAASFVAIDDRFSQEFKGAVRMRLNRRVDITVTSAMPEVDAAVCVKVLSRNANAHLMVAAIADAKAQLEVAGLGDAVEIADLFTDALHALTSPLRGPEDTMH